MTDAFLHTSPDTTDQIMPAKVIQVGNVYHVSVPLPLKVDGAQAWVRVCGIGAEHVRADLMMTALDEAQAISIRPTMAEPPTIHPLVPLAPLVPGQTITGTVGQAGGDGDAESQPPGTPR